VTAARSSATGTTWIIRGVVAVLAGVAIGAAGGVAGVRRLEPAHPGQSDSLQQLQDSVRKLQNANLPREQRRAADSADAARRNKRYADSVALANDPNAPTVPDVATLDEAAARNAIETAGLTVGTVQFRASTSPAGIVLLESPPAGQKVRAGTAVNLVLSDGRTPPTDTGDTANASTVSKRPP
jgi:hypothetical protein